MKRLFVTVAGLGIAVATLMAASAQAQQVCDKRVDLLSQLLDQYAERPVAIGIQANGTVLEVLVSQSGSWTILITDPQGVTCALTSGQAWQATSPHLALDPGV